MNLSTAILKAPHVGVRELKAHLSQRLRSGKPLVVTEHGDPKQVMIPYETVIDIVETLEELNDEALVRSVRLSRKAGRARPIPVRRRREDTYK